MSFRPRALLLTWRGKSGKKRLRPGDFIGMKVRFLDPLEPAWPGGYDPQFVRWFQGIGASGFLLGAPEKKASVDPPPGFVAWASQVERVREEGELDVFLWRCEACEHALLAFSVYRFRESARERLGESRLVGLGHLGYRAGAL